MKMGGKVLITGGAGFIGSSIADLLISKGYSVIIVDNLVTGNNDNINKKAKFYDADITKPEMKNIFSKEKPDFVIHEAAQINVRASVENPVFDATSNILGTINVLECCREFGVKKILYSSSGGACYGEPEKIPCDEGHPVNPVSHYGVSKHSAEHYLFLYNSLYKLDYTILRYANVYGPRQDPKGEAGVISIFLGRIARGQAPTINGDGKQTRDFVYVEDVARANLLALERSTKSRIFNIGCSVETSVNEIYAEIKKAAGKDIEAKHGPAIPGEVFRISLNCKLAEKELGWKPAVSLKEGIARTAAWFDSKI